VVLSGQTQGGHQEELRGSQGRIAFERFLKEHYRFWRPAEHKFGKSAEKEEDALPPICPIELHRPLDRRKCFPGATEEGGSPLGRARSQRPIVALQY
jgi:hypothetical protein